MALGACGPAGRPPSTSGGEPGAPAAPKVLNIAVLRELTSFTDFGGTAGGTGATSGATVGGNAPTVRRIAHDFLIVANDRAVYVPHLATEEISAGKGTWRINADGTMDVTWRLRPNVKWQDGSPFTSADLMLAFELYHDPTMPTQYGAAIAAMESATAPEPLTFNVHWSKIYAQADQAEALDPVPSHLLAELYHKDKTTFVGSPLHTTSWVGLGPYKLARWEAGAFMEFTRFDDFYLGRPPLDKVVVQLIPDTNTMVANFLARAVDFAAEGLAVETAVELTDRLQAAGDRVRMDASSRLDLLEFQMRQDVAKPAGAGTNQQVRQALFAGTDRRELAEVINHSLAPVADDWFAPGNPLGAQVSPTIPKYPYDMSRAQSLLAQAGWIKGSDGVLTNGTNGQRFEIQILARAGAGGVNKAGQVAADQWRALGVQASPDNMPAALAADREYQSKYPGVLVAFPSGSEYFEARLHSGNIASDANRWAGRNRSAYANPAVDRLMDRLAVTIDAAQAIQLHKDLAQAVFTDVPIIPLTWEVFPALIRGTLKGDPSAQNAAWNIFGWDR